MSTCKLLDKKEQKVLSVRTQCDVASLPMKIGEVYKNLAAYLDLLGGQPCGAPFVAYFNMDMSHLDVEIGFPVKEDYPGAQDMKMSSIPAGPYAETIYTGSYETLRNGYDVLMKWMAQNKFKGIGVAYEIYLNDPASTPAEELQTELLFPLAK